MARARHFYQDVLGFYPVEVIEETGEVVYRSGGISFFVYPSSSVGTNQGTAAAWRVPDLRAAVDALEAKGVVFEDYDFEEINTVDSIALMSDGTKVAWFNTVRETSSLWISFHRKPAVRSDSPTTWSGPGAAIPPEAVSATSAP